MTYTKVMERKHTKVAGERFFQNTMNRRYMYIMKLKQLNMGKSKMVDFLGKVCQNHSFTLSSDSHTISCCLRHCETLPRKGKCYRQTVYSLRMILKLVQPCHHFTHKNLRIQRIVRILTNFIAKTRYGHIHGKALCDALRTRVYLG